MTRQDELDDTAAPMTADQTTTRDTAPGDDRTIDLTRDPGTGTSTQGGTDELMAEPDRLSMQERWTAAQGRFVDDPQAAVREADALVSEVVQAVTRRFADQRDALEQQWASGDEADTEQLRQALQRYRSRFSRLLAA